MNLSDSFLDLSGQHFFQQNRNVIRQGFVTIRSYFFLFVFFKLMLLAFLLRQEELCHLIYYSILVSNIIEGYQIELA